MVERAMTVARCGAADLRSPGGRAGAHRGARLVGTWRDGTASRPAGVLEDHGAVAEAFIAVLGITGDAVWLDRARLLRDRVVDHFADPAGGFFDTADDAESLVVRPKDVSDNAYPSGTSAAVTALLSFAAITGDHRYRAAAESGIASAASVATQVPRFAGWTLAAAEAVIAGPLEIAVVGRAAERTNLHRAALGLPPPGAVVIAGEVGMPIELFAQRDLVDGKSAAYVCRGFVCERPVSDPQHLKG